VTGRDNIPSGSTNSGGSASFGGMGIVMTWKSWIITKEQQRRKAAAHKQVRKKNG